MIFRQFYLPCLAHASYVIGDEASGTAAVLTRSGTRTNTLHLPPSTSLKIKHVIPDASTRRFCRRTSGTARSCRRNNLSRRCGESRVRVYASSRWRHPRIRTHAPEGAGNAGSHAGINLHRRLRSERQRYAPHAVLTGDTLFIGDVGRPDLRAALGWSATELGGMLFDSLHTKLLALPDPCLVYPAHGAGSLCGKAISKETVSTLGRTTALELRAAAHEQGSIHSSSDGRSTGRSGLFQLRRRAEQRRAPHAGPGAGARDESARARSPCLHCRRPARRFSIRGMPLNLPAAHLGRQHQHRPWPASTLPGPEPSSIAQHPIVLIADPGRENESAVRLGRIGFDHVAGYLQDGLQSLEARPDLVAFTERLSAPFAAELLSSSHPPLAIDVRTPRERDQKCIAGSLSIPLNHLMENLETLPQKPPLAGVLRRRLPLVHRRQPVATLRI